LPQIRDEDYRLHLYRGSSLCTFLHSLASGAMNTSTAVPQCPGVQLGHPVPGGYKYGNLALQDGGVSDETVKYGREF
jgi:hypothetical protein